jgi:integrase
LYNQQDGVDPETVPPSAQLFFRHFFEVDALPYVRRLQRMFAGEDFTTTHQIQLWDFVRDFWHWVARHPPDDDAATKTTRVCHPPPHASACAWPFLLDVYRAQGGGGLQRSERLPTPCAKALSAVKYGLRAVTNCQAVTPPLAGPEYRRQIRMVHAAEECLVPRRLMPALTPHARRTYTAAECGALLAACQTQRDRLLLLLLLRVGLRNAALRRLALRDVTEEDPPHAPVTMGRAYEKGGVIRPFLLDPPLRECLAAYLNDEHNRLCTRAQWHTACVFPRCHTQPDHPMTAGQLHFWFGCLRRRAGVHGLHATIHGFRHYLVTTLMADRRNRLCDVSAWIGHRSVATTANCYWHTDVQEVHQRLVFPWTAPPPLA